MSHEPRTRSDAYDRVMWKAVLALALLAVMAAAWVRALSPVAAPPAAPTSSSARARRAAAEVPIVQLDRLTSATRGHDPLAAARDPFRRAVAPSPAGGRATALGRRLETAGTTGPSAAAAPGRPAIDLIGVAESGEGPALVRTAIVAGPRGVHHLRVGEVLEQVYRLEGVTARGATLRLLAEDRVISLALRP